jgi:hypothetical protein
MRARQVTHRLNVRSAAPLIDSSMAGVWFGLGLGKFWRSRREKGKGPAGYQKTWASV